MQTAEISRLKCIAEEHNSSVHLPVKLLILAIKNEPFYYLRRV